jgi:nitrite reductase/ring-hydroxylating ferredoxin subunit
VIAEPLPPPRGTPICAAEEVVDGRGRMFAFGDPPLIFHLLILRSGEKFLAYRNRCPHFGITLAAKDEQLIINPHMTISCNTHYARFRWHDGYCEAGDCEGESLEPIAIKNSAGMLCFG